MNGLDVIVSHLRRKSFALVKYEFIKQGCVDLFSVDPFKRIGGGFLLFCAGESLIEYLRERGNTEG